MMSGEISLRTGKILRNKAVFTVTLILMLTAIPLLWGTQSAEAAVSEVDTFLFVMASPNPVDIAQQ